MSTREEIKMSPVEALDAATLRNQIELATRHTAAADSKAGALLTATGLLAAVYTALAVRAGTAMPDWLAALAATATVPVAVALVLLLFALRPRLAVICGPLSFFYGPEGEPTADLKARRDTVTRIAVRKYKLVAVAVDVLICAVVSGVTVLALALPVV
jgi:hypothetical protein